MFVTRFQNQIIVILVIGLFPVRLKAFQDTAHASSKTEVQESSLELTTQGQLTLSNGRRGAFRIYTSRDGIKGAVSYGHFASPQDAEHQFDDWIKLAKEVTSKQQTKDDKGHVISDRILATRQEPRSGGKEFLIIRRKRSACYFIQSLSLTVARQVEGQIEE